MGPLTGSPSERVSAGSCWHSRDSSPSAARSVRRATRTLPVRPRHDSDLAAAASRVRPPSGAFARVVVLGGHRRHESMEARLAGQLRMERRGDDVALADGDDPAVVQPGEDVDVRTDPVDDRRPDEDAVDRSVAEDRDGDLALERVQLPTEGVPLDRDVEEREDGLLAADDVAGEQDHPGAGAEHRRAGGRQVHDRLVQAPAMDELADGRAFAAGQDQPAESGQVVGQADLDRLDADRPKDADVLDERTLDRQHADLHGDHPRTSSQTAHPHRRLATRAPKSKAELREAIGRGFRQAISNGTLNIDRHSLSEVQGRAPRGHWPEDYQPRTASRSPSGIASRAIPRIGAPRPLLTSAITFGLSKWVVAWTMALAIRAGSSLLKMPDPTNTPSAPSCIARAASAGVAIPPATKLTTGS